MSKDLGLALAPKMCPDQSQAFKEVKEVIVVKAFFVGRRKMNHLFFWTSRFQVLQAMFVQIFAQIFEELTACMGKNITLNLTPKIEYTYTKTK